MLQAEVIRPRELGPAEVDRWREMRAASTVLRSPFLAPEYALAVDRIRDGVRVAVLSDGPSTVGFFCFEQRRDIARPLGHGLTDVEGIVYDTARPVRPRDVLRACRLNGWDFETLVEAQVPREARSVVAQPVAVMDVSGGYEAYLEALRSRSKSVVQTTQRKLRKMERELGELRFEFDERDPQALRTLMDWKSGQYREMGEWDRFGDPGVVALLDDLFSARTAEFAGILSVLYLADRPIAAHFGLAGSRSLAQWFPAYDPSLSRFSPGMHLHFGMAEGAAARGLAEIDLGRGVHGYKEQLKTGDLTVARGSLHASGMGPGAVLRKVSRAPRDYLRPWLRRHPRLEHAVVDRLAPLVSQRVQ